MSARTLAEAWDEGYRARRDEGWRSPGESNPYHAAPPAENRCEDYDERDCPRYCGEDGCGLSVPEDGVG